MQKVGIFMRRRRREGNLILKVGIVKTRRKRKREGNPMLKVGILRGGRGKEISFRR
jgi:hypothetical protein